MKKKLIITIVLLGISILPNISSADSSVDVWVFGMSTCPYCQKLKAYMESETKANSQINYTYFEMVSSEDKDKNRAMWNELKKIYGIADYNGVPTTFIGDRVIKGNRQTEVDSAIEYCLAATCESPAQKLGLDDPEDEPVVNPPADQGKVEDSKSEQQKYDVQVWEYGATTCPYCQTLKSHLSELADKNQNVKYSYYEIYGVGNQDSRDDFDAMKKAYGVPYDAGIPVTFVGDQYIIGARTEDIDKAIEDCSTSQCPSLTDKLEQAISSYDNTVSSGDSQTSTKEEIIGWVMLGIFVAIVGFFGVKIIKERK